MKEYRIVYFYPVMLLLFLSLSIFLLIFRSVNVKTVKISDGNHIYYVKTINKDVESILKNAKITYSEDDTIIPDLNQKVDDMSEIIINRVYTIEVIEGSNSINIKTTKHKVKDILAESNILLEEGDDVIPDVNSSVTREDKIVIVRQKEKFIKEKKIIPYKTVYVIVDDLENSKTQEPEDGEVEVEYLIKYKNNKELIKEEIKRTIIKEPVNEIIYIKDEDYIINERGLLYNYSKVIICKSTAYDLSYESCGKKEDHPNYGKTFMGTDAKAGVIAVDPKVIPLGSVVYVKSMDNSKDYGFARAEDTGTAVKNKKVDLFVTSRDEALRYGIKDVKVYIIESDVEEEYFKGFDR